MIDIEYRIKLHTYWHCGSGLAAGADVDSLVVRDKNGMPYIPGKTVKGLLREATEDYLTLSGDAEKYNDAFVEVFGYFGGKAEEARKGKSFFSNAELEKNEYDAIVSNGISEYMFKSVSSTAIEKDGVAKEHSLRKTEVVVPCTLTGKITDVDNSLADVLVNAAGMIKGLGTSRNRGLGRCTVTIKRKESAK